MERFDTKFSYYFWWNVLCVDLNIRDSPCGNTVTKSFKYWPSFSILVTNEQYVAQHKKYVQVYTHLKYLSVATKKTQVKLCRCGIQRISKSCSHHMIHMTDTHSPLVNYSTLQGPDKSSKQYNYFYGTYHSLLSVDVFSASCVLI